MKGSNLNNRMKRNEVKKREKEIEEEEKEAKYKNLL